VPNFDRTEKVRIIESKRYSEEIYIIKDVKKVRKGGVLYLLKSLENDSVLRICYENNESLLERVS
jgi:hypothetical protein